ncbi:MAG: hypothetical protein U9N78_08205 [Actinomycetota bacterium]|nr:hypothetical protein [Actinomycetota bacterium]
MSAPDTTVDASTTTTKAVMAARSSVVEDEAEEEENIPPPVPPLPPIVGYGDYTGLTAREVPWDEVNALLIRCLRDQGWDVTPIDSDGISFESIPLEQSRMSEATFDACYAGLNLPDSMTTRGDVEAVYDFWVEQAACLRGQGVEVPEAPSRETFLETYPAVDWVPYRSVPGDRFDEVQGVCPQAPWDA